MERYWQACRPVVFTTAVRQTHSMLHLGYFAIPQLGWIVKGAEGNTASTRVADVFLRGQYDQTLTVILCNLLVSSGINGRRRQLHRVPSTQQQRHGCCTLNFDRHFSVGDFTYGLRSHWDWVKLFYRMHSHLLQRGSTESHLLPLHLPPFCARWDSLQSRKCISLVRLH